MFGLFLERATKEEEGWGGEFSGTAQLPVYRTYGPQLQATLHCNSENCVCIYILTKNVINTPVFTSKMFLLLFYISPPMYQLNMSVSIS